MLALMLMPIAVTALLFSALAIGWARRADEARERRQGPWFMLAALAALALLVGGGVLLRRALRPFDPRATDAGRVLSESLSTFVTKTSFGQTGAALAETREALTGAVAQRALGTDASRVLGQLLDAAGWVAAVPDPSGGTQEAERFFQREGALTAELAKRNLPYFVDADILSGRDRPLPLLMSFYIERESVFESAGVSVRTLDLWRLDTLAVRYGALGYTRPRTPAAPVLLDQVEGDLVRSVLPALAPGEPSELVDDETRELRNASAHAYEHAFGEPVPRVVKKSVRENAGWRH